MTSSISDPTLEIDHRLQQASRTHRLRSAGRGVVAFGSVLLIGQAIIISIICAWRPEAIAHLPGLAGLALFALLITCGVMLIIAAWIERRSRVVADAEQELPTLGRRLSTSFELRDEMDHHENVPKTLRSAVYADTGAHLHASPWDRFVDRRSAALWAATAAAVVALQGFFVLQTVSSGIAFDPQPTIATASFEGLPDDAAATTTEPDAPRIDATITIIEPAEDQWATRIEAVPITFQTHSTAGFTDLTVVVNHNGKTYHTAAFTLDLESGDRVGEAEFYLDEMPLEDYDVLAYHVEGRPVDPAGRAQTTGDATNPTVIASGLKFIQIRPFNEDILFGPLMIGEGDPCLKVLAWMIEEERRLVRGGWLLQPGSGLPTTSDRYVKVGQRLTEDHNQLRGVLREARVLFVESPGTTPLMLTLLDEAGDAMDAANVDLTGGRYIEALPHQQQALGRLVAVLREFEKIYGRFLDGLETPEPPDGPKPPAGKRQDLPEGKTLADRQLMRDDISALDYELEEIAQQQAQLNWEQMQEDQEEKKQWRQHDVPQRPDDSGTPPEGRDKEEPDEAEAAKKKQNKPGTKGDSPTSQGQSPSNQPGSGQTEQGQGQGQTQGRGQPQQQQEQQPQQQQPGEDHPNPPSTPRDMPQRQLALAERLDELAKTAVTGESVRQALREAAEAMYEQAARQDASEVEGKPQGPRDGEPGRRAADLLDRARDERDRELEEAHLRQIENLMRRLAKAEAQLASESGSDALDAKEREELADDAERLARATEARGQRGSKTTNPTTDGRVEQRRASATASLREAADTLRSMSAADPEAFDEELVNALDQLARAQRELEGGTKQLESLERRLSQLEDQLESQARRNKPASGPAHDAWKKDLDARGNLLAAQLRAAELDQDDPKEAQATKTKPNDPSDQFAGEYEIDPNAPSKQTSSRGATGRSGPAGTPSNKYANVYQKWKPNLVTVRGALGEVRQALNQRRARDPLATQRAGQSPEEYRQLVEQYFESLSRNAVMKPGNAK